MAYTKTSLISRPVAPRAGFDGLWDTIKGGAGSALDFFGAGIKAQGAAEALQAQAKAQAEAQAAAQAGRGGGIPTTYLVVGGIAVAGLLVFAMRRK